MPDPLTDKRVFIFNTAPILKKGIDFSW